MCGWFRSRPSYSSNLPRSNREWVERHVLEFVSKYSKGAYEEKLRTLPQHYFRFDQLIERGSCEALLARCCELVDFPKENMVICLAAKGENTRYWRIGQEESQQGEFEIDENFCLVPLDDTLYLPQEMLYDKDAAAHIFVSEFARSLMLLTHFRNKDDLDVEILIDLFAIMFGFGTHICNSTLQTEDILFTRETFLSIEASCYTLAIYAYVFKADVQAYLKESKSDYLRKNLEKDFAYVSKSGEMARFREMLEEEMAYQLQSAELYMHFERNNFQIVINKANELLRRHDDDVEILFAKADALFALEQYKEAFEVYQEIFESEDEEYGAYKQMMLCKLYSREMEGAKEMLESALAMDEYHAFTWVMSTEYFIKAGQKDKAIKSLEKAKSLNLNALESERCTHLIEAM